MFCECLGKENKWRVRGKERREDKRGIESLVSTCFHMLHDLAKYGNFKGVCADLGLPHVF